MIELLDAQIDIARDKGYEVTRIMVGGWYMKQLCAKVEEAAGIKVTSVAEYRDIRVIETDVEVLRLDIALIE